MESLEENLTGRVGDESDGEEPEQRAGNRSDGEEAPRQDRTEDWRVTIRFRIPIPVPVLDTLYSDPTLTGRFQPVPGIPGTRAHPYYLACLGCSKIGGISFRRENIYLVAGSTVVLVQAFEGPLGGLKKLSIRDSYVLYVLQKKAKGMRHEV
ncbi:hypothetical protein CRG98_030888 [Punica granatum]|uniref:Uncharacterized protein n=1 Tax=Punica granatum TaxID=22663 RepID=A0A2I0IXG9_PUNGR|nr:hypothetical protein CRG98_030888 [Punica granatum]